MYEQLDCFFWSSFNDPQLYTRNSVSTSLFSEQPNRVNTLSVSIKQTPCMFLLILRLINFQVDTTEQRRSFDRFCDHTCLLHSNEVSHFGTNHITFVNVWYNDPIGLMNWGTPMSKFSFMNLPHTQKDSGMSWNPHCFMHINAFTANSI